MRNKNNMSLSAKVIPHIRPFSIVRGALLQEQATGKIVLIKCLKHIFAVNKTEENHGAVKDVFQDVLGTLFIPTNRRNPTCHCELYCIMFGRTCVCGYGCGCALYVYICSNVYVRILLWTTCVLDMNIVCFKDASNWDTCMWRHTREIAQTPRRTTKSNYNPD